MLFNVLGKVVSSKCDCTIWPRLLALAAITAVWPSFSADAVAVGGACNERSVAFVGATVIDGNGGSAKRDRTLVVCGSSITAIGTPHETSVPPNALVVDARGKYLVPGFIDTNIHVFLDSQIPTTMQQKEKLVAAGLRYVQLYLENGITTLMDTHGVLGPTIAVRDSIKNGSAIGPRLLVAGNVVGWGGAPSVTYGGGAFPNKPTKEQWLRRRSQTQGVGEELVHFDVETVKERLNKYLDRGVDFVKYGGTTHNGTLPLLIFSPRVQAAIISEVHKRGKVVTTHCSTTEAINICVKSGADVLQHANVIDMPIPDGLARFIAREGVVCSLNPKGTRSWKDAVSSFKNGRRSKHSVRANENLSEEEGANDSRLASTSLRDEPNRTMGGNYDSFRRANLSVYNAKKLIRAGCNVSIETDGVLVLDNSSGSPEPGVVTTLAGIEALVDFGMSPGEAIVAATRNGAIAAGGISQFGTLEVGKSADILMLSANPLEDIRNIRKLDMVLMRGRVLQSDRKHDVRRAL